MMFEGPGEAINLVPQNMTVNRGRYRVMERELAEHALAGRVVEMEVEVLYTGNSLRPDTLIVKITIDGVRRPDREFPNEAP